MTFHPTPEQQKIIDYVGTAYVRACPGAGKTRTIVYRLKRLLSENGTLPRRGAALLSFTNSAVDEFKEKCVEAQIIDKIGYPNFVGTFDSFLWRFIALPALQQKDGIKPALVESWSELYVNLRSPCNIQGKGASLGYFSLEDEKFNLDSLRGSAKQIVNTYHDAYSQEALKILRSLAKKGLFSTDGARRIIAKKLQEDAAFSTALGEALRARFYEVIVDETQDCNNTDILILNWLKDSGISVLAMCDPAQAIYEFRNKREDSLENFTAPLPLLKMTSNFRCAPTICKVGATLRAYGTPDSPEGPFKETVEPVRVFSYSGHSVPSSVGNNFLNIANEIGLPNDELISLAHDRNSAMRAAGVIPPESESTGRRYRFAKSVADFHTPGASGRMRERAMIDMMKMILEQEGVPAAENNWRLAVQENQLDERELRRRSLEIIGALSPTCRDENEAEQWIEKAKEHFQKNTSLPVGASLNRIFVKAANWYAPLTRQNQNTQILNYATIHEAKGKEYLGVLLSIKPGTQDTLDAWATRNICEEIRVLFVGATRAKRLLGLAIHNNQRATVEKIFNDNQIPFVTTENL